MGLLNTLNFILSHPLNRKRKLNALGRFIKWQVNNKLNPYPIIYPFTDKSKLIIKKGMTGATGNLYCGLHEFNDMAFLLHFLRAEDLFVDIGANIGSYTILAAAHVGANVISIEPIPQTYDSLRNNIKINNITEKVKALNIGLGSEKGILRFTRNLDTVNHIVTDKAIGDTIDVDVATLDSLFEKQFPSLIKIDVEGFETEVLKGAPNILHNNNLKAIIIELNGSGKRYGFDEEWVHQQILNAGFETTAYFPFTRELKHLVTHGYENTIYIRDRQFVESRLKKGEKIKILGNTF